ncbi:MAG TPA: RDD family protein [Terriglobales bacterium]|nr:RDD family protein [Terriglobales bacterium]
MNSPESQFDSDSNETYFDPEAIDSSEQFFSASLERIGQKAEFVVDSSENSQTHPISAEHSENLTGGAPRPSENSNHNNQREDGNLAGPEAIAPSESLDPADAPSPQSVPALDWRDLVSAKVKNYKTAKPRPERYPSLQLSFESRPAWKPERTVAPLPESQFFYPQSDPPQVLPKDPPPAPIPLVNEATARVLEFPRPGMLPFNREELAEPVIDRPRIIEAPELLPPPPALGGISITQPIEPEPERQPGLDMPLATARLSRKIFGASIDGLVVLAAITIFGYMFLRFNPSLPPLRLSMAFGLVLGAILWFAYQSAFIICCGTTLGLRAARLRIMRFDGTVVPRKLRRWRVVASVLSGISLGLGYAWCFFDEDELSWHDRITKTHLAPE